MNGNNAIWDKLMTDETYAMIFNDYNKSIGNALRTLSEQPQRIQGRDIEIDMLASMM